MATIAHAAGLLQPPAAIQGRANTVFSGLVLLPGRLIEDFPIDNPAIGMIRDRVMIKRTPSAPETPFVSGLVLLLRLADRRKAWEGWSDAQGWYSARGLEVGVEYLVVGIDPFREHKATAAGPVLAVKETP